MEQARDQANEPAAPPTPSASGLREKSREELEACVSELARKEALHHHIIESLPGGVFQIASDGSFLSANAEGLRFLGMSMEQLRNQTIPDFGGITYHENGEPCGIEEYPASLCLATGQPQPARTIGVRRPGEPAMWAVFTAVPVPCPIHPGRTGTVVTFLNITQRKRAEDALRRSEEALRQAHEDLEARVIARTAELARINQMLREQMAERARADAALRDSEERFRQMAENVGEVVWIVDARTQKVLYISPAYESIWGRSCQSVYESARSFLDAVIPEDQAIAADCFDRQVREPFDGVYRIRGRYGEVRWVRSRTRLIHDAAGHIHRVTGIAEDITDLKNAEAELSRLASIVESSDDAIIGKTLDGMIVSWNSGAERIYGYTASEMIGCRSELLLPRQERGMLTPLLARVARGERIASFETQRVRKDGTVFQVSLTLSAVRDSAGHIIGASGIERDITERKRLEQEVLQISERERRRIGQDLHDGLGQHLTGIGFLSKALQQRLAHQAAVHAPNTAHEAAEAGNIVELVQQAVVQTRALARGLHPVEASANGLMAALGDLAGGAECFSSAQCAFECAGPVHIEDNRVATHLYRIAQEAVNNAIKHASAKHIRIQLECTGGQIRLAIEDDGTGMPDDATGPGLGLRIMQYRAKMIGGNLTLGEGREAGTKVECMVASGGTPCGMLASEPP